MQNFHLELGREKMAKIEKIIEDVNLEMIIDRFGLQPLSGSGCNIQDKYLGMKESDFKQRFINSITGSLQERIIKGGMHTSSLPKLPQIDQAAIEELNEKYQSNENFKKYLKRRKRLPAFGKREEIINALEKTNKLLISGETGCGKTTQVAQFILEQEILSGRASTCSIICTQPTRISAVSVATRVASERGEKLGESVGYQIRLEKEPPRSYCSILYCTTGILLRLMQEDPFLTSFSHILLDEIHERDILSDFVITLLKDILPVRPDLKIILMSASLNAEKFSRYLDNCPLIHIPGVTHPIKVYYLEDVLEMTGFQFVHSKTFPYEVTREREKNVMPYLRQLGGKYSSEVIRSVMNPISEEINLELIISLLAHICTEKKYEEGAVLIFLPGWDKISMLHNMMTKNNRFPESRYLIIPLHSMMPSVTQQTIFDPPPPGTRKIIISTSIAETSITIDDIVYVIDCGKIKVNNYDTEHNITTMKEEWVSLANAQQRRGRAGRVQAGYCFHLFTSAREKALAPFQVPGMLRTRLENVILQAKILQLGKIAPFLSRVLDPPSPKAVELSLKLLREMRALDDDENLTPLGYHLGILPVDPQAGKMLLFASLFSCFDPIASVAACLGFKNPFFVPIDKEEKVNERKQLLSNALKSDHLLLANVVGEWEKEERKGKGWEFCKENYLSHQTLRLLRDMKKQFAQNLYEMKFLADYDSKCISANYNSHKADLLKAIICAGLYPNIALIKEKKYSRKTGKGYVILYTPEDGKVEIHPKSINNNRNDFSSLFMVYFQKIKTSRIFLHDSTSIPPLALILFCQKLTIETSAFDKYLNRIAVNETIKFTCSSQAAELIKGLRSALDWILEKKIAHPGISDLCDPFTNSAESRMLRAIVELVTDQDEKFNYINYN